MTEIAPALPFKSVIPLQMGVEQGIHWFICEAPLYGSRNGYVYLPDEHPWLDRDYDEMDVEVHGGLTFKRGNWIGFDTLHLGDIWPRDPNPMSGYTTGDIHWTEEMVVEETKKLARQIRQSPPFSI